MTKQTFDLNCVYGEKSFVFLIPVSSQTKSRRILESFFTGAHRFKLDF